MAVPNVDVSKTPTRYQASEVVEIPEGESQVTLTLPEIVPTGKKVELHVDVRGVVKDAE